MDVQKSHPQKFFLEKVFGWSKILGDQIGVHPLSEKMKKTKKYRSNLCSPGSTLRASFRMQRKKY
jgi:hypothetical protein